MQPKTRTRIHWLPHCDFLTNHQWCDLWFLLTNHAICGHSPASQGNDEWTGSRAPLFDNVWLTHNLHVGKILKVNFNPVGLVEFHCSQIMRFVTSFHKSQDLMLCFTNHKICDLSSQIVQFETSFHKSHDLHKSCNL